MKSSISYPDWMEEVIDAQVEAGIAENRSEWFQDAGMLRINLQQLSQEALGGDVTEQKLDELGIDTDEVQL